MGAEMKPSQFGAILAVVVGLVIGVGAAAIGLGAVFGWWLPVVLGLFASGTFYAEYIKIKAHQNQADRR